MSWFAAYTKPRSEFKAQDFYTKHSIVSYVPAFIENRQWSDRLKKVRTPAISGYIFIKLDKLVYDLVNANPFTRNIVKNHMGAVKITNKEIDTLKACLENSSISKTEFINGDMVYIENGPFKNKKGEVEVVENNTIVLHLNKLKVKLSLAKSRLSLAG